MRFTLTYEGSLPASGNQRKNEAKWRIRKAFDPQLRDLWNSHPALREIEQNGRYFPKHGLALRQAHHDHPAENAMITQIKSLIREGDPSIIDLCEPIEKHDAWFRPLVRDSFALHCGLKIVFLRKEPPGRIYQARDLDGRMKTLIDSLTMPQHAEQVLEKIGTKEAPLYCLLEEDSLVSGLNVESERLLTDQSLPQDYVKLTIEVDVRVRQPAIYNYGFL
jgi:hypothetical protein